METKPRNNKLVNESSPYLKQHAENPVNWYPWNEESLKLAKDENKPILLSIGYAACHWCHVMAHESFSDEETARLMNSYFINIKVDREERPDLDKIYQTAHYLLTQQNGGWPLTVFLTPELIPFFSGTYFPKEQRYHLPAFKQVLQTIAQIYSTQPDQIEIQNSQLRNLLQQQNQMHPMTQLNDAPIFKAQKILHKQYDALHGGFNGAPKFPQVSKLLFLLDTPHAKLVYDTLTFMANGGIYDQLGGGFFRYTVDAAWQIPHFEKMLYDNALLLYLYADAFRRTQNKAFADVIHTTVDWCKQLRIAEGGFYSSLNADSEGEEGKYYLWDHKTFNDTLIQQEQKISAPYFGLNLPPNFEGKWHLFVAMPINILAKQNCEPDEAIENILIQAKQKLLTVREQRIPPSTDTKILTTWNSLLIKSLYYAGWHLSNKNLIVLAEQNLQFILHHLFHQQQLLSVYAEGKAKQSAFLDDYVFLMDALLMALQVKWNSQFLQRVQNLADYLIQHFIDDKGGFYFTADTQEKVLYRPKTFMDEATPSGNGIAAQVFLLLGYLLADEKYLKIAEQILVASWRLLENYPSEHSTLLIALKNLLVPHKLVIIRGEKKLIEQWQSALKNHDAWIFAIPNSETDLPETLKNYAVQDQICAYVCQGNQCSAPVKTLEALQQLLAVNPISVP